MPYEFECRYDKPTDRIFNEMALISIKPLCRNRNLHLIHVKAGGRLRSHNQDKRRKAMPMIDALILGAIVFAFVAFGVALAWGERQTRNLGRSQPGAETTGNAHVRALKTRASTAYSSEMDAVPH